MHFYICGLHYSVVFCGLHYSVVFCGLHYSVVFCRLHNSAVPVSISSGAESVSVLLFVRNGMLHTHATSTHQATNICNVIFYLINLEKEHLFLSQFNRVLAKLTIFTYKLLYLKLISSRLWKVRGFNRDIIISRQKSNSWDANQKYVNWKKLNFVSNRT